MKNYEAHRLEERHDANIPVDNFSSSSQIKYEQQMNFSLATHQQSEKRVRRVQPPITFHMIIFFFNIVVVAVVVVVERKLFPYENIYRLRTCFDFLSAQQFRT